MNDTIFALATAPGRGAVAVIRLSGPAAREALEALRVKTPKPRQAALRRLRDASGQALDRALVLWFPAPRSYTGEDCAELHLHGGAAVIDAVTMALLEAGLRLAEPGEFTRRAFESGKLDLGQAEAVADLIDAESAGQARQAMGQLDGALGRRYERWREMLVDSLAGLEAAVDFPDEEIPADVVARAAADLEALRGELGLALEDAARGRRVRDGYRVAILGAPNAGKSSLFNNLVGRDAVIVAAAAGTTRDVLEAPLTIAGYRVILADMAGLRRTRAPIEAEGVRRARDWAANADLRLWIVDRSAANGAWREAAILVRPGDICLMNKIDLPIGTDAEDAAAAAAELDVEVMALSLLRQDIGALWDRLTARVTRDLTGTEFPAATRARHAEHLRAACAHLERALLGLHQPELAAEDVRLAARALQRVSGRVGVEDVLDRLFASFCIGK
jgi:tRNA modification GTPase